MNTRTDTKSDKFLIWIVRGVIVLPMLLDFIFYGSKIARISRVLMFALLLSRMLSNIAIRQSEKAVGIAQPFVVGLIYSVGSIAAFQNHNNVPPNFLLLFLFGVFVAFNRSKELQIRQDLFWSLNCIVAISAISILIKYNPRHYFAPANGYPVFFNFIGIPGRNLGITSHANTLGSIAALAIICSIVGERSKIGMLLGIFCLLKAGSRTSDIITLFAFVVIVARKLMSSTSQKRIGNRKTQVLFGNFPFILIVTISVWVGISVLQILIQLRSATGSALTGRIAIWTLADTLFRQHLTFGLGWNWELFGIAHNQLPAWAVTSHNAVLEVLFSAGYVGVVLFLYLILFGLIHVWSLGFGPTVIYFALILGGITEANIDFMYPDIQAFLFLFYVVISTPKLVEN